MSSFVLVNDIRKNEIFLAHTFCQLFYFTRKCRKPRSPLSSILCFSFIFGVTSEYIVIIVNQILRCAMYSHFVLKFYITILFPYVYHAQKWNQ